jgi:hypothetical protein
MGSFQHGAVSRAFLLVLSILAVGVASQHVCAAADSSVLSPCEDPTDFSAARTPDAPSFEFSAWDATVFDGARVEGSSIRWHMRPSTSQQTSGRIALTASPGWAPDTIGVWVKNPNAHDLALRLEVIDADGATYLSPPVDLVEETGWREVAFELAQMNGPAADPSEGIDAPLVRVAFTLDGLTEGRPHTIYLDEITATGRSRTLTVSALQCQTSLGPGEPVSVRAELSPASAAADARIQAELASAGGGALAWTPLAVTERRDELVSLRGTLRVPEWLAPGRYRVRLTSAHAALADAKPVSVVIGGAPPSAHRAQIVAGLSPPAIRVGDTNLRPVVEELRGKLPAHLSEDARIVGLPATTDEHPFAWALPAAREESGELSFTGLDRRVAAVLTQRPRAALILQVFINATRDWESEHPEHLQHFEGETLAPAAVMAGDRSHPDICSEVWQRGAQQRLRALVQHVARSSWGHRVVGYELQAGDLGSWRPWGASLGIGDDRTAVRHQAFVAWLHDQYEDAGALRDGWLGRRRGFGRPRAGFESVEIPLPLQDAPEPSLYDPASDQPRIDLMHFRAEAPADALLAMAQAVREESGDILVGGCYGHLLSQARANAWHWPHTALSRVLEDGALDFLTGPMMRIDDVTQPSSIGESVRRAEALYLERVNGAPSAPDDCGALVEAGAAGGLARLPNPDSPSPGATVIEVIDDFSARYLSGDGALPRELLARPIAGSVPHRTHLLRDLLEAPVPEAGVYVFRDLFTIEPEAGRLLARNTCRNDSLLVWIYAPGAVDDYLITGRTMQYLTGIKLSPLHHRGRVVVQPESGLLGQFGLPQPVSPVFISADEGAEWLGTLAGSDPARCGFALREFDHCTSVFAAAPPTEEVLRHLARRSGIDLAAVTDR